MGSYRHLAADEVSLIFAGIHPIRDRPTPADRDCSFTDIVIARRREPNKINLGLIGGA